MNLHQVYALQACLQNDEVNQRVMDIYVSCVKYFLKESHRELANILGPSGFLVLSLFERPSLLDGLPTTLMEQFPKVRHLIQDCVERQRNQYAFRVKKEMLAYLETVMGVSAYYLLASVAM